MSEEQLTKKQRKWSHEQVILVYFKVERSQVYEEAKVYEEAVKKAHAVGAVPPSAPTYLCVYCRLMNAKNFCYTVSHARCVNNLTAHAETHIDFERNMTDAVGDDSDAGRKQCKMDKFLVPTASAEATKLYSWMDLIITEKLPFVTVASKCFAKYVTMDGVGVPYFMEMLEAVGKEITKAISSDLPSKFGLILDGEYLKLQLGLMLTYLQTGMPLEPMRS
jgi:hypothetical protein